MANLSQLNRKIKSINVTSRITHALEVISSTYFHTYRDLQKKSLPYLQGIYRIFYEVYNDPDHDIRITNKRLISYEMLKKQLWVVIGSDISMCGDFNDQIKRYMNSVFDKGGDGLVILGNKLKYSLESEGLSDFIEFDDKSEMKTNAAAENIKNLSYRIFDLFMNKHYQKLNLVYLKDPSKGIIEKVNILPFTENYFPTRKKVFVRSLNTNVKYPEVIIDIFPQYFECLLLGALISSKLGEHVIRRELMHHATKNAQELLDKYHLEFNKLRQASITQEITEITVASKTKKKSSF